MGPQGIGTTGADLAALRLEAGQRPELEAQHEDAGKKFESLMATMLVKQLRESLPEGFFGKGPGADSFGGWLDKALGDALGDSLGIAGMVKTGLDAKQARLDGLEAGGEEKR